MYNEDEDDKQRQLWAELVRDAKIDVNMNVPSLYSYTIMWAERERLRLQEAICEAVRVLDISATQLESMQKKYKSLEEALK